MFDPTINPEIGYGERKREIECYSFPVTPSFCRASHDWLQLKSSPYKGHHGTEVMVVYRVAPYVFMIS